MIDTTILIDYFRKSDKSKSRLVSHFLHVEKLYISTITEFEIYNGAKEAHKEFWERMLTKIGVLDFDSKAARKAAQIVSQLKLIRKTIDKPDLFIAATAITQGLTLDTLNLKHFIDIEGIDILKV